MRQIRAAAVPAEPAVARLCADLASALNLAPPRVARSPFLASPCVVGLWRPLILLPEDDPGLDRRATLIHELAHLARRDGGWNLGRRVACALLWFQPLLWVLARRLEGTAEEVCDDHVVQAGADRAGYAGLLLDLASRSLPPRAPTAVGMVALRSLLARRVVRILDRSRTLSTRAGTRAVVLTATLGLLGTLLAASLAIADREPIIARAAEPPVATQPQVPPEAKPAPESHQRASRGHVRRQLGDRPGQHGPGVRQQVPTRLGQRPVARADVPAGPQSADVGGDVGGRSDRSVRRTVVGDRNDRWWAQWTKCSRRTSSVGTGPHRPTISASCG